MPTDVNDHWPEMIVRIVMLAMLMVFVLMLRKR
jgi:hypothetical protein